LTEIHGLSDTGDVRPHNEDGFLIDRALGLAVVADGMGGHMAGEVASAGALAALHAYLAGLPGDAGADAAADPDATAINQRWRHTAALLHAVERANSVLYAENRERGHADGSGMGCTLTGIQTVPGMDAFVSFHVGDSRLYRHRDGVLTQLTRDQTAYQLALESGAPGALPPQNLLLQAVGPAAVVTPDIALHEVQKEDVLLLCSDGLHGWVPHAELEQLLGQTSMPLAALCGELIALAKRHSSRDNITALLLRF
jgi:protein phosphatase